VVWMRKTQTHRDQFESQIACVSPDGKSLFTTRLVVFVTNGFAIRHTVCGSGWGLPRSESI